MFEQTQAGIRRFDPTRMPHHQLLAEFLLEPLHMLAQRRLRDMQHLGRRGKALRFDHGDEIGELTQVDHSCYRG